MHRANFFTLLAYSRFIVVLLIIPVISYSQVSQLDFCEGPDESAGAGQFKCKDGYNCIRRCFICDGIGDCIDRSDEENCTISQPLQCGSHYLFACKNGRCIPRSLRCDRDNDCGDASDEECCKEPDNLHTQSIGSNSVAATSPTQHSTELPPAIVTTGLEYFDHDAYTEALTTPMNGTNLDYLLDYEDGVEDIVSKHRNFDSTKILRALTEIASLTNTTPNRFHLEMRQLLSSGDDQLLDELLRKYSVTLKAEGPDSVTLFRLQMIFPHYCNLGQKPFYSSPGMFVSDRFEVPTMLQYEEFGGLIPHVSMCSASKKLLISLHLYLLSKNVRVESVPLRVRCTLLKERMEKSMLSDDHRTHILQVNQIVKLNGEIGGNFKCITQMTSDDDTPHIIDCIPHEFRLGCTQYH